MEETLADKSQHQVTSRLDWGKYKEVQFVKMLNTVYDKVFFGERISSVFHTVYLETSILTKQQD